jgi:hypothetical protein
MQRLNNENINLFSGKESHQCKNSMRLLLARSAKRTATPEMIAVTRQAGLIKTKTDYSACAEVEPGKTPVFANSRSASVFGAANNVPLLANGVDRIPRHKCCYNACDFPPALVVGFLH